MRDKLEAHGKVVRWHKPANGLWLNIFPGKKVATFKDEKMAQEYIHLYNSKEYNEAFLKSVRIERELRKLKGLE